jgi:hypothetical protein
MMDYVTRCCTPAEARKATEHFDEKVVKYLCESQRVQRSELTASTVEEMLSPLMLGGTGIVATCSASDCGRDPVLSFGCNGPTYDAKDRGRRHRLQVLRRSIHSET